jgi:hypothetical protein
VSDQFELVDLEVSVGKASALSGDMIPNGIRSFIPTVNGLFLGH